MKTGKKSVIFRFYSDFKQGFSRSFRKNQLFFAGRRAIFRKNFKKSYQTSKSQTFTSVNQSNLARPLVVAIVSFALGLLAGLLFNPTANTSASYGHETGREAIAITNSGLSHKSTLEKAAISSVYTPESESSGPNKTNAKNAPSSAQPTLPSSSCGSYIGALYIPDINFGATVTSTYEDASRNICVPESNLAGALTRRYFGTAFENKTLIVGHASGVFAPLFSVRMGHTIVYLGKTYTVVNISRQVVTEVNMRQIIKDEDLDTIVLMTCAGFNSAERLIITAALK